MCYRPSASEYRARQIASGYSAPDDEDGPTSSTFRRNPSSSASSLAVQFNQTPRYPLHTPTFKRIDFDDIVEDSLRDRKPAWRTLQDDIKDSYHKVFLF